MANEGSAMVPVPAGTVVVVPDGDVGLLLSPHAGKITDAKINIDKRQKNFFI